MKNLLAAYLSFWARRFLARTDARIVAITGSVGKTSTKEAIGTALARYHSVRISKGNLNNELGVPLAILGKWDEEYYRTGGSPSFWFGVALEAPFVAMFGGKRGEILVLEYGADRPGDIGRLVKHFPPHIAVVTAVGDIPVHVEYFASSRQLAHEKAKILSRPGTDDRAVLNADDLTVLEMRDRVRGSTLTFGTNEQAQVRVSGMEILSDSNVPEGMTFNVHVGEQSAPVRLYGALGRSQMMAVAATVAVGQALGLSLQEVVAGLADWRRQRGRPA